MSKNITRVLSKLAIGVSVGMAMSPVPIQASDAEWSGYAENATYYRNNVGISKSRNTAQVEFTNRLKTSGWSNVSVNGVLRATYDAVYDLNDDEFGKDATQPYLGSNWHDNSTVSSSVLLTPGVPFPCQNDPTLCDNLDSYMDQNENDARYPDFNDRLDFLRELYITGDKTLANGDVLSVSLGKQQVIWGKTDLFRVLDVINPVDYSRHNIYDELEDIRIPQWLLNVEWRMGANSVLDDSNLSLVWNFDKFRPHNLGTCGQAYRILDVGCFFSSRVGTPNGLVPIIHDVDEPEWKLGNTQFGIKWEGVYRDATFSLNAMHYRQQLPSIHFRPHPTMAGLPAVDGVFDVHFPEVNMVGGSVDYYSGEMDSVLRLELAYSEGEEFPRDTDGYKETDIVRYVVGLDKNLVIPSLGTGSAFLISTQLFGEHILDHENDMPNKQDNWIATLLFKGWYKNNRLSPQMIVAHDFGANATVFAPSISWAPDNHWSFNLGLNIKTGGDKTFPWGVAKGAVGDFSGQAEPLARFLNGPIGVANQEDEIQLSVRYSF